MKNLMRTLLLYIGYLTLSILFYQCCTSPDIYRITGSGDLSIVDVTTFNSDTIRNNFSVSTNYERELVYEETGINFISEADAWTCEEGFENMIIEDLAVLTLSGDFIYDGLLVPAGTNLLNFDESVVFVNHNDGSSRFLFFTETIDNVEIESGGYTITYTAETTDNILIESEVSAYFELNQ